jgi:hypothetical protein
MITWSMVDDIDSGYDLPNIPMTKIVFVASIVAVLSRKSKYLST